MRFEERTNDLGQTYVRSIPETESDLPVFRSYAAKEQAILDWKELYAEGRAVRGIDVCYLEEGKHGYCLAGLSIAKQWKWHYESATINVMVQANNDALSGHGSDRDNEKFNPVKPESFAEVLDYLQRCSVG